MDLNMAAGSQPPSFNEQNQPARVANEFTPRRPGGQCGAKRCRASCTTADQTVCVHVLSSLCYCATFGGAHIRILEVAQNFEEQGSEYFRGRSCKEALGFYTHRVDANPNDTRLKKALLLNCLAYDLELRASFLALSPFYQVNLF
jgi:hypothetical protein